MTEENIKKVLKDAKSLHETLYEPLRFLENYRFEKIEDSTADKLIDHVNVFQGTKDYKDIKFGFQAECLEKKYMKVPHTIVQNRCCTDILYLFLALYLRRGTILNILINNSDQFLVPSIFQGFKNQIKSQIKLGFQENSHWQFGKTPLFPNQWTRSCMAVN